MKIEAPAREAIVDVHISPRLSSLPSGHGAVVARSPVGLRATPAPSADTWPRGVRLVVLVLSIATAWAVLVGLGWLIREVILWGRS